MNFEWGPSLHHVDFCVLSRMLLKPSTPFSLCPARRGQPGALRSGAWVCIKEIWAPSFGCPFPLNQPGNTRRPPGQKKIRIGQATFLIRRGISATLQARKTQLSATTWTPACRAPNGPSLGFLFLRSLRVFQLVLFVDSVDLADLLLGLLFRRQPERGSQTAPKLNSAVRQQSKNSTAPITCKA